MCRKSMTMRCARLAWVHAVAALGGLVAFSGSTWAMTRHVPADYPTIQAGIDASAVGDTVLLAPGTYSGTGNYDIEFRGRDIVLTSSAGAEQTIIDCQFAGRGFNMHQEESRAARIERVTIRNGWARGEPGTIPSGGGVSCLVSFPTIADCIITQNIAQSDGGGIFLLWSAVVERCVITGNSSGTDGGGLALEAGDPTIRDCVITDNTASEGGGVACTGTASNILIGCTVSGNSAGHGGGVRSWNRVFLERCIVWGNYGIGGEDELVSNAGGGADIRCTDIDTTGVGGSNIDYDAFCVFTDPLFCGPDNWMLDAASPCLPEYSPCGELIGALGLGCGGAPPTGACCLEGGACVVEGQQACVQEPGVYMGDGVPCLPNTCVPTATRTTSWGQIKTAYR